MFTAYLELAIVPEPMAPVISSHGDIRPSGGEVASSNFTLTFLTPSPVVRFTTRPDIVHLSFAGGSAAKDLDFEQRCRAKNMVAPTMAVRLIDIVNDFSILPFDVTKRAFDLSRQIKPWGANLETPTPQVRGNLLRFLLTDSERENCKRKLEHNLLRQQQRPSDRSTESGTDTLYRSRS